MRVIIRFGMLAHQSNDHDGDDDQGEYYTAHPCKGAVGGVELVWVEGGSRYMGGADRAGVEVVVVVGHG